MDSKDVVEVLKACKGLNLKKLSIGELKLEFHDSKDLTIDEDMFNNSTRTVLNSSHKEVPSLTTETEEVAEVEDLTDFELGLLQSTDPVLYEEKLKQLKAS